MKDFTKRRKRTTLYAAFTPIGDVVVNVWDWRKKELETLMSDRRANGEAIDGEHMVRIYVTTYNEMLSKRGLPTIL